MSMLIVYGSKYGATKAAAEKLAETLGGDVQLYNLEEKGAASLAGFDTVVVSGPIYAGMLRKSVKRFCQKHEQELLGKKLGLFLCCASPPEEAARYFEENFPKGLLQAAAVTGMFGGECQYERMKFLDRKIMQMVMKSKGDVPLPVLDEAAIQTFAQKMNG